VPSGELPLALFKARHPADWALARALIEVYAAGLDVDLAFQGFDAEVRDLAAAYPDPGGVWLARRGGVVLGCVALRGLDGGLAELKRLHVLPSAQRKGVGRALVETAVRAARAAHLRGIRLDTLPGMGVAAALYRSLGFEPIPAYRHNPVPGTQFLELSLEGDLPGLLSRGSTR
jgi:ribosomal protein S18 acetylase RimI-like enzyme